MRVVDTMAIGQFFGPLLLAAISTDQYFLAPSLCAKPIGHYLVASSFYIVPATPHHAFDREFNFQRNAKSQLEKKNWIQKFPIHFS